MGMALKKDVAQACRKAGTAKPIDLVHLSNQTMGDRNLEVEILKMFSAQMAHYIDMAKAARNKADIYRVAHTIKGAARGVGAIDLAEIALAAEREERFDFDLLCAEFDRIDAYIGELCVAS